MKFQCLKCGKKEFEVNTEDIINDQLFVIFVCPDCGAKNQVSFIQYQNGVQIELIEKDS
jgi:predicted RNA-binding Zn-ribbon protein involved in translation (DUF1610 family)